MSSIVVEIVSLVIVKLGSYCLEIISVQRTHLLGKIIEKRQREYFLDSQSFVRIELEQSSQKGVKLWINQGKIVSKSLIFWFDLSHKALNNRRIQRLQVFLRNSASKLNYLFQLLQD